jgi:hypothetical protein
LTYDWPASDHLPLVAVIEFEGDGRAPNYNNNVAVDARGRVVPPRSKVFKDLNSVLNSSPDISQSFRLDPATGLVMFFPQIMCAACGSNALNTSDFILMTQAPIPKDFTQWNRNSHMPGGLVTQYFKPRIVQRKTLLKRDGKNDFKTTSIPQDALTRVPNTQYVYIVLDHDEDIWVASVTYDYKISTKQAGILTSAELIGAFSRLSGSKLELFFADQVEIVESLTQYIPSRRLAIFINGNRAQNLGGRNSIMDRVYEELCTVDACINVAHVEGYPSQRITKHQIIPYANMDNCSEIYMLRY